MILRLPASGSVSPTVAREIVQRLAVPADDLGDTFRLLVQRQ